PVSPPPPASTPHLLPPFHCCSYLLSEQLPTLPKTEHTVTIHWFDVAFPLCPYSSDASTAAVT
ncbi:hypothetical protein JOQ06_012351, partial [Pogonophryne albipinna]